VHCHREARALPRQGIQARIARDPCIGGELAETLHDVRDDGVVQDAAVDHEAVLVVDAVIQEATERVHGVQAYDIIIEPDVNSVVLGTRLEEMADREVAIAGHALRQRYDLDETIVLRLQALHVFDVICTVRILPQMVLVYNPRLDIREHLWNKKSEVACAARRRHDNNLVAPVRHFQFLSMSMSIKCRISSCKVLSPILGFCSLKFL
jgi:hypothetical protein